MKNIFSSLTESPFPNLTEEELLSRIRNFRRKNIRNLSDDELANALYSLFLGTGESYYSLPYFMRHYPPGQKFFRVRSIPDDDDKIPLKCISSISDAWEPPANLVCTDGRVNKTGDPVLYTCAGDPLLAFKETKVQGKNNFCLFVYEAKKEVKFVMIGSDTNINNYSETDKKMIQHIFDFFETEFVRDVGKGSEHLYRISYLIAHLFYSYPHQDAWCYRSSVNRSLFNCAFMNGRAKSSLKLIGGMICSPEEANRGNISPTQVVDFSNPSKTPTFHQIGSEMQIALFPEIAARGRVR